MDGTMKKPGILIVEDVGMIADYMELILSRNGYRIAGVVSSGEEAVAAVHKAYPDLVLMDIKIHGEIDGISAAGMIRELSEVPIVYVSAYTDRSVIARAMATRPSAYLFKPFKSNELIGMVRKVLERGMDGGRTAGSFHSPVDA